MTAPFLRAIRAAGLAGIVLLALALAASAQSEAAGDIDYARWNRLASNVEQATASRDLETGEYQELRARVVDWRSRFLEEESTNSDRIATLQGQIDALGPAPDAATGEGEPEAVSTRRAELQALLAEAQAPRIAATEAFNRADGLIREIDGLIRARDTEELVAVQPSPLNPRNWAAAATSLGNVIAATTAEVRERSADPAIRSEMRDALPVTLLLASIGALLILRGRVWSTYATDAIARRWRSRGRLALSFLVSFAQLVVPVLGLVLLAGAVLSTGILGEVGEQVFIANMRVIVTLFLALWLAGRLFPADPDVPAPVVLAPEFRPRARILSVAIGFVVGLTDLVELLAALPQVEPSSKGVIVLPLYVALSYLFYRLSGVLRRIRQASVTEEDVSGIHTRLLAILVPALRLVAVVGPVLAAAGYLSAAERLMLPTAYTLGILGLFQALQVPIRDLYAALTRKSYDDAAQALVPVLLNFALAFAALPVLAMIWGVRPAQIWEIYARFNEGFSLGEARITPGTILAIIAVFAIGFLATRLLQGALRSAVLPRTSMDTGARNAITAGVGYVGIALAAVFAVVAAGIDLTALAFVISALSVGIGFGLQNVVSNFVSGIILLIERPISEGDWIEVNGQTGIVKAISVRSTRIETFDKTDVIVPNADFISGTVTNWTRGNVIGRAIIPVGVAYGTDTRRVEEILLEIARAHPVVAAYPEPGVDFLGFGADALDFRIRAILRDVNQIMQVKTEINHQIAERFAAEGIEIPFAQRDIWLRNPEALHRAPAALPPGEAPSDSADQPAGPVPPDLAPDTDTDGDK